VDVLYSREIVRAPRSAEVSPPEKKPNKKYKKKLTYIINKGKEQLSKESEKRMKAKREDSCELRKNRKD
jgi:hypothetical protein